MPRKIINQTESVSEGVEAYLEIESFDGEKLDTAVKLTGEFGISFPSKNEFFEKLSSLIDEYRI